MRTLRKIHWAIFLEHPNPPLGARTKSQQAGLRYEAHNARMLSRVSHGAAEHGRWINYEDANEGEGWRQPDHFILSSHAVVIFESKLTQCVQGDTQLRKAYGPLLQFIFGRPPILIQIFRNIVEPPEHPFPGLACLQGIKPDPRRVWHWHNLGAI